MIKNLIVMVATFAVPSSLFAADEVLRAKDNGEINCQIAKNGLTRISLTQDRFSNVTKMTTGVPSDDFTVVNEPTRGDIYISLPHNYSKPLVSFFGTSAHGYVYKFMCRIVEHQAHQVFVENLQIGKDETPIRLVSVEEQVSTLVEAMYAETGLEGYEIHALPASATRIGSVDVFMLQEYRSGPLIGRSIRIRNLGSEIVSLDETEIAPPGALAVSLVDTQLSPGGETLAFIVIEGGEL